MLELVTEHDLAPDDIAEITFRAGHNILNPLRYPVPRNELEAKFCIPFVLSSIVLRRRAGIREFHDDFVLSEEVADMMRRVTVQFDEAIDARGYDRMRSAIDVRLRDGTELHTEADTYPGGPERPLSREELHAKFRDCASLVMDDELIDAALEILERVDELGHIGDLVAGLSARTAVAV